MALPKVDAVCVGMGWAGGILAAELTKAGMSVVGLERGGRRGNENFAHGHDELRYAVDKELAQNVAVETWTLRHNMSERALPIRRLGAFSPGSGVGGSGVSWAGQTWRFSPRDFEARSRTIARYGAIPAEMSIQDWGVTYDELEPYYDRFEYMAGISGKAGNVRGSHVSGGNPFEGPRSRGYPTPPMTESYGGSIFRTNATVVEILHDGGRASGVRYRDETGRLQEQPADIVLLTAYMLNNCRLLLLSNMGEPYDPATGAGVIGKNYCYQADGAGGMAYFADKDFKPYMTACGGGVAFDDLNGDNFDHTGLGFLGGGLVRYGTSTALPINGVITPPGTPTWGARWKQAIRQYYPHTLLIGAQGESPAYRDHFLDLDPTYRDANGLPLLRITFDWRPNERAMVTYLGEKISELVDTMDADFTLAGGYLPDYFNTSPYQSTHNTGGVIMGADPGQSAVNSYLQMWDFPNVFVVGASPFPQNPGYNPTGTVGALAYRAADGIVNRYRTHPGPLV